MAITKPDLYNDASKASGKTPVAAPGIPADAAKSWLGWVLALTASLSFSFATPIARGAISAGVDPTTLVALRLMLTTLLTVLTVVLVNRTWLRIDRRGLSIAFAAGALNGFGMLLLFWALARVQASMASMFISLIPLGVLSLLALRGERFTHRHTLRLILGVGGVYLVVGPGGSVDSGGIVLMLSAVTCFSVHMALLQWYLRPYEALTVTLYVTAAMTAVVLLAWLGQGASWRDPGLTGWLAVIGLVVVSTYFSRLLMVAAINHIGSGQMALLTPFETLLTIIWSMLFLGERLTPVQWLGGVLILASALLAIQRLGRARWRPRWRLWARA